MLLRGPWRRSHQSRTSGNDFWNRYVFSRWRNRVNEGDDWISDGRVFHRVDAATGNDRRPMDSSRYAGMSSWCDVDERRLTDFIMGQLIKTFTDCYYCIFILSLSIFPPTTICTDCDLSTINKDGDDDDDDDEILVENRNFYTPCIRRPRCHTVWCGKPEWCGYQMVKNVWWHD